jgi:hypothetical protein
MPYRALRPLASHCVLEQIYRRREVRGDATDVRASTTHFFKEYPLSRLFLDQARDLSPSSWLHRMGGNVAQEELGTGHVVCGLDEGRAGGIEQRHARRRLVREMRGRGVLFREKSASLWIKISIDGRVYFMC